MDEQFYDSNNSYENSSQEIPVYTPPTPKKREKKNRMGLRICALALVFALLGGALGAGGVIWYESSRGQTGTVSKNETAMLQGIREKSVLNTVTVDSGKEMTAAEVYAANVNSTVGITTSITTNYWGFQTTSAAAGSGFILTEDGYILTNYHVVENSNSITVAMYNGDTYDATLIGYDESNDVAVLKVDAEGLSPVVLGDSDNLNVGDSVVAIGNPLGELTFTMTAGYISALDREITPDRTPINMLQTDVAINAGNSGGPLFDMDGNVIGMTTAKVSGTTESGVSIEGLGFAIPINDVMRVVYDLQLYGRVLGRAYLGVTLQDLDSEVAATYNLPAGPQIVTVTEGSCAETAGLQPRDIILQFEDREISSFTDLSAALAKQKAGDTVTLKIYRAGAELEITLTLDERPGESEIDATEQQAQAELEGQTAPDTDIPDFGGFEGYGYDYDMD